jgi:hypothetical protein
LLGGEPVPKAHALGSHSLHARDAVASSGASSPLSAASTASFRAAVIGTLMETAPSPRASHATRQAATVAFVKPGRGPFLYQKKNSSRPRFYTRLVIGEETESSTGTFSRRQSAPLSYYS